MKDELETQAYRPVRFVADQKGAIAVVRSSFLPFEGEILPTGFTKFGLNIGRTSQLYRKSDSGVIDEPWRRNGITVNLPNEHAIGSSGRVTMMGLAVDFGALGQAKVASALEPLAQRMTIDTVAANHLRKLFAEAELHGCSSAFFEAGLEALLRRLTLELANAPDGEVKPLDERRLKIVRELIDSQLANPISVREMAAAVEMSQTRFAKSFKSALGVAPFQYLTAERMKQAKTLLRGGQEVTDVAVAVGYANPSKFAAAFRKLTGHRPTEWRYAEKT